MYVCLCRGITEKGLRTAIDEGAESLIALCARLGVGVQCGACCETIQTILDQSVAGAGDDEPLVQRKQLGRPRDMSL